MNKKNIAIIGTAGLPANYGGFETLAEHLVEELGGVYNISVYCTNTRYKKAERVSSYNGARLIYLPFNANGIQSIIYDAVSIIHAIFYADVLLVLGVPAGFLIPFVRLFTRKKIIVSIDGMEWKRGKWSKLTRWYLWASEWLAVRFAHANIADNESIQDYTAIRYRSLSSIIEYGADHTQSVTPSGQDYIKYPFLSRTYAIKVCRIEPENNIHVVLEAFTKLTRHILVIVGNWNGSEYGRQLHNQYSNYHNIFLLDPIYNQHEIDLLRGNAAVYIHGHSAGGTNPSLVEAMYLQLPVIAFNVMYNRTTTENNAFYFKDAKELIAIMEQLRIKDLKISAAKMKEIADRRYTWKVIADKYSFLIRIVSARRSKRSLIPNLASELKNENLVNNGLSHLQFPAFFYEKR